MKKKKYLPLYEKWMETGKIEGYGGLCHAFPGSEIGLFEAIGYWGYWADKGDTVILTQNVNDLEKKNALLYEFTPLRQTVVLFLAAMNDEL